MQRIKLEGMQSPGTSIEELLQLAREDLNRMSLTTAEKTLEQAILLNNQSPEAFHLLGNVYTKKGKFKKAALAFEKTLSLDPFHTEAAIALSALLNDMGKYQEGAKIFQKTKKRLERMQPGHDPRINQALARKHHELALLYLRYERFSEASEEFSKAMNLEPDNVCFIVQIAKCQSRLGQKESAIQFLRKQLGNYPKSVDVKIQLGILYHTQQKLADAYKEWQEALALDPDNKSAQMYLSMLEYQPVFSEVR